MDRDEKFSPMLDDIVLLNVIREIDYRLPNIIKSFYFHKMAREERLMDFKTGILLNIPNFLRELDDKQDEVTLNVFKKNSTRNRNQQKFNNNNDYKKNYCRLCHLAKKQRATYTTHSFGDIKCPSLSIQDRQTFINATKLSAVQEDESQTTDDEELAELHGYCKDTDSHDSGESAQVVGHDIDSQTITEFHRNETPACNYIQPVSSQILTVFVDEKNSIPFHIELDSGATVSYIRESVARAFNFVIKPNKQIFKLGDGLTKLDAVGEVKQTFFRKSHKLV